MLMSMQGLQLPLPPQLDFMCSAQQGYARGSSRHYGMKSAILNGSQKGLKEGMCYDRKSVSALSRQCYL
eukprot:1127348-Amphidinium_carterae.1